ncbi:phosphate ABC transporter permease subunit PstC [Aquifex aeolicus]|uniref:Phosphate transport system permease protein n=1 Tax=Aquifex aeolicus (strain VF5) TaxID=224324 RepID=O67816_AQUAE|nr:phosphate ABC transporter permease subunit PstC [Aquifex aeolicus]AAC07782.1 phosphate transport system permease protein C [Aquifex aeolicus VF5]
MDGINRRKDKVIDKLVFLSLGFFAFFLGLLYPLFVGVSLLKESWLAIQKFGVIGFITGTVWDPVQEIFGGLPAIVGTLITTFLASLIAIPVCIGIAIFIAELCPKPLKPVFTTAIELLGAIPSIIYGMWGFFIIAPLMADYVEPFLQETFIDVPVIGKLFDGAPTGIDVLTSSFVLSIMIIPFMASIVKDAFEMTPQLLKEAGYGMGATKWEVIKDVIIPYAFPGIVGGAVLSVGRALGETMAVAFLTGNVHQIPKSLFDQLTTITVAIANEFTEAHQDIYLSSLYYLALILFIMSFLLLILSKFLIFKRLEKRWKVTGI